MFSLIFDLLFYTEKDERLKQFEIELTDFIYEFKQNKMSLDSFYLKTVELVNLYLPDLSYSKIQTLLYALQFISMAKELKKEKSIYYLNAIQNAINEFSRVVDIEDIDNIEDNEDIEDDEDIQDGDIEDDEDIEDEDIQNDDSEDNNIIENTLTQKCVINDLNNFVNANLFQQVPPQTFGLKIKLN